MGDKGLYYKMQGHFHKRPAGLYFLFLFFTRGPVHENTPALNICPLMYISSFVNLFLSPHLLSSEILRSASVICRVVLKSAEEYAVGLWLLSSTNRHLVDGVAFGQWPAGQGSAWGGCGLSQVTR